MAVPVLGFDVGGTFTDFALLKDGELQVHKVPSTPPDPTRGILRGIGEMGVKEANYVHGSTVATNAFLERKGARTAFVTTKGFEDILEIGRQNRPALYDLMVERPPSLVPRELRFGAAERVEYTGKVLQALEDSEVQRLVRELEKARVDSVAVSLLFSFLNPLHEEMLRRALEKLSPRPFISISSQVLPEFREYERSSTVVVNAYVGPIMARYLSNLEQALGRGLRIMQSSGGSITATLASTQPVRTILSGPAGGVVASFHVGSLAGYKELITLDMGGTSTDVSLCPGRIKETTSSSIGGYPIGVPMIEIHTVGAGGGSIARLDQGGALLVGPESAGADPGPVCYGKGEETTVTDANLVLGRLQPKHFLGGRMALDLDRARDYMERLARKMGTDVRRAALGIIRVVNSNMERAIRAVSLERGYDPRQFTLLAFGGAGALHSCDLAQELGIPRVLVPPYPGILSALGVAIADIVKDYSQTVMMRGKAINPQSLDEAFAGLEFNAREEMAREGLPLDRLVAQRSLDVRYVGQSFELNVDYPSHKRSGSAGQGLAAAIAREFHKAHQQRFGYSDPTEPIEIVNVRLKMVVPVDKPLPHPEEPTGESPKDALVDEVPAIFQRGEHKMALYMRDLLHCGNKILGPALVLQMDATTLIPPGWKGEMDRHRNLILTPGQS